MRKLTMLLLLALTFSGKAQINDTATKKLDVFSSIGLGKIDNDFSDASGNSVQTTTGLELRLSPHSGLGASLSFDSYGYQKSGASYILDGSLKATALALFYRYKFGRQNWQPFLKAGGGTAWLTVPMVSVAQGITNIQKKVQNVGVILAELGFQVRVLPRYSLLLGAERKWMAKASFLDDAALGTSSIRIGLISAF